MATFKVDKNRLVCSFPEQMTTEACLECEEALYAKADSAGMPVVFDMTGVEYIASRFISMCIRVVKKSGKENFSLANVHPNVKKVLKIARLDDVLDIT
ncbi:MAG: STAS domain-containing protein [Candidatus Omnitrophota bacterium]